MPKTVKEIAEKLVAVSKRISSKAESLPKDPDGFVDSYTSDVLYWVFNNVFSPHGVSCIRCGKIIPDFAFFCSFCGQKQSEGNFDIESQSASDDLQRDLITIREDIKLFDSNNKTELQATINVLEDALLSLQDAEKILREKRFRIESVVFHTFNLPWKESSKRCSKCGYGNQDNANFCHKCGLKVT